MKTEINTIIGVLKMKDKLARLGEELTRLVKSNINNVNKDLIIEICGKIRKLKQGIKNETK